MRLQNKIINSKLYALSIIRSLSLNCSETVSTVKYNNSLPYQ